jgi:hypothetical protein
MLKEHMETNNVVPEATESILTQQETTLEEVMVKVAALEVTEPPA